MKALVFRYSLPRLAVTRLLGAVAPGAYFGPWAPLQLEEVPEPRLPAPDWLIVRTVRCGLCGSDAKQAFLRGSRDNPLTALISFPHVLGHEAVGIIENVGSGVRERQPGDRVVVNPWLSCGPRGIDPPCDACQAGDYPLCAQFTAGRFAPGMHAGNCRDVSGGFAERIAVHESQALPIPDSVDWEVAALADPCAVMLHAILRHPPPAGALALVVGAGTLGLLALSILRVLYPETPVAVVARYRHQVELARRLGATEVLPERREEMVEAVAELTGARPQRPWAGGSWLLRGVGVVYDTVGSPASVEASLRVAGPRATVVVAGVEAPRRFEWTGMYFKELSLVGSNAFGVETFEGRRLHAMLVYFELLGRGLDPAPLITHRFSLDRYREAFLAVHRKGRTGAVKAMFAFPDVASESSSAIN